MIALGALWTYVRALNCIVTFEKPLQKERRQENTHDVTRDMARPRIFRKWDVTHTIHLKCILSIKKSLVLQNKPSTYRHV